MRANKKRVILGLLFGTSALIFGLGLLGSRLALIAGGGAALGCLVLKWIVGRRRVRNEAPAPVAPEAPEPPTPAKPKPRPRPAAKRRRQPADPNDTDALFVQMLAQGRYALLLRPQVARNLQVPQVNQAMAALQEGMALVPDGEVTLNPIEQALDRDDRDAEGVSAREGRVVRVGRFFLDRYPVTNREFYEFVAAGGYEQISIWDEKIWPAVLDFVDQTGEPGPRFWKSGCYESGLDDHPVVGVSWYEASAYARWLGKRLPTDAEWAKAGAWPVQVSPTSRVQRRYPWGDTMDRQRANLWGSGPEGTVAVDQYAGVSVGGVSQLIGNVWEWTRGDFGHGNSVGSDLMLEVPMKSIRGGAFDTYFDNQATCQFQSGEVAVARKDNIGFRCAVGACDLMLARAGQDAAAPAEPEAASLEEVKA